MSGVLDSVEVELVCEACGRKTKKTVGWIESHENFTCPCGLPVRCGPDSISREVREVNRGVDEFLGKAKSFINNIKGEPSASMRSVTVSAMRHVRIGYLE